MSGPGAYTVGDELPARSFGPITLTDIVRYQGASGDMNPMHHDDGAARDAGYREAFGVGMLTAGYLATWCVDEFGPESVRRFRTRFRQLSWRGDILTARGHVREVATVEGELSVTVAFELTNEQGMVVTEGDARFALSGPAVSP